MLLENHPTEKESVSTVSDASGCNDNPTIMGLAPGGGHTVWFNLTDSGYAQREGREGTEYNCSCRQSKLVNDKIGKMMSDNARVNLILVPLASRNLIQKTILKCGKTDLHKELESPRALIRQIDR